MPSGWGFFLSQQVCKNVWLKLPEIFFGVLEKTSKKQHGFPKRMFVNPRLREDWVFLIYMLGINLFFSSICGIYNAKKNSLWVRWIHYYYSIRDDFWRLDELTDYFGDITGCTASLSEWVSSRGSFATKAYDIFRCKGLRLFWAPTVWALTSTPKHNFIFWLAVKNRLPTCERLSFLLTDLTCPICTSAVEKRDHLLFQCSLATQVWDDILRWLSISRRFCTLNALLSWTWQHVRKKSNRAKCIKAVFSATIYCLWVARNLKIFEDSNPIAQDVVQRITTHVYRILIHDT